jgi:hypothetical protein
MPKSIYRVEDTAGADRVSAERGELGSSVAGGTDAPAGGAGAAPRPSRAIRRPGVWALVALGAVILIMVVVIVGLALSERDSADATGASLVLSSPSLSTALASGFSRA